MSLMKRKLEQMEDGQDIAEAMAGVTSSLNALGNALPKFDYFIEALETMRNILTDINTEWELSQEEVPPSFKKEEAEAKINYQI